MKWVIRIALVLTCAVAVAGERRKVEMIMTGEWHGDEVNARSGEQWLALVDGELEAVKVRVELVHDPIIDDEGEKSGKRVVVSGADEYTVLLRGLAPTSVERPRRADLLAPAVGSGAKAQLILARDAVTIETRRVPGAFAEGSDEPVFEIVLSGGGVTQSIGRSSVEEVEPIWSGDVDGDGKLDLIIDTSDHYNVFAPALFLSTEASDGEIVGQIAAFVTSGC